MENVLHDLFTGAHSQMIKRATILSGGKLTPEFGCLTDFLEV